MSDEEERERAYGWGNERLNEDMQFSVVPGGPARYVHTTDKAVEYVTVAREDGVLGYLWACDADDAAGWQVRPAGGDDAYNAGVSWTMRLRDPKARGLTPSQALAELAASPGNPQIGRVVAGSRATASGLAELRELAGANQAPKPETPRVRRGS
ncbi:hypothetical protein [Kitasatospora terrestris]|uniref:DUF317 domain-containing protein n=1 Tax=Kitasatospora terrestris TaxID=258051 RepID=A0ABP9EMK7_9ACTN